MLYILDLIGVIVFAISGAIVARDKQFDLFGGIVLATVTAIGGGTFRDLTLGRTPVFWLTDLNYLVLASLTAVIFLLLFRVYTFSNAWRNALLIADAMGLAVFTVIGVEIALVEDIHPVMAVVMGAITGCFGGVIRDVLANREPLIFQQEIYATASIAGGAGLLLGHQLELASSTNMLIAMGLTFGLRMVSVYLGWHLPAFKPRV